MTLDNADFLPHIRVNYIDCIQHNMHGDLHCTRAITVEEARCGEGERPYAFGNGSGGV